MRENLAGGIVVNYLEGTDTRTGRKVTSCSGLVNRTYFRLGIPETGPEAVRKLRVAVETLVYFCQK